jgi:hypothetical protein
MRSHRISQGEKGLHSMSLQKRARTRRLTIALTAVAFATCLLVASAAFAADQNPQQTPTDVLSQLANSPVYEGECTALCHSNIANTKNYANEIIFTHGNHILMQCSDCHPRFPHRQSGTEKPTMKGCWNCHGLRHGPRGVIAKGECEACHLTPKWQLRPAFHTDDWALKPHVKPAEEHLNDQCMMCHKPADCITCHEQKGIKWQPKDGWDYDPSISDGSSRSGCLTCHGNATLLKTLGGGNKSFEVSGVENSAHRDITCQQCHPDYRYDDKPSYTKLWNVNAGIECGVCHQDAEKESNRAPVPLYRESIHAQKIRDGNYDSATCGSCHGGHFIQRLDSAEASEAMHASAYRTCARCKQHGTAYETYNDYYHGRAYKKGATDAPACWQCHASHKILPKNDPESTVYAANLGATCGQAGCHKGSNEKFAAAAGQLIHQKTAVRAANPVLQFVSNIRGMIGGN